MERAADISRIGSLFSVILLIFSGLAMTSVLAGNVSYLPMEFFRSQDIPVVIALMALLLLARLVSPPGWLLTTLNRFYERITCLPLWVPVALVFLGALAGAFSILGTYPLSMDEYWARADGYALMTGKPMAEIPAQFREYAAAMQPIFTRISGDSAFWASTYLPVNALFQGLLGPFASPIFAAGAMAMMVLVVRQQLPDAKAAPIVCLILAATSAQWIITGMTTYSMSAHLFFNLAWLVLVHKRGFQWQIAAGIMALLAVGLHQFAFFPVFAGFFVLELFLQGRRSAAIWQGIVIGGAVVFWSMWDGLSYDILGTLPPAAGGAGSASLTDKIVILLTRNDISAVGMMGMNLVRFQLWQNPLLLPLFVVAIPVAWKLAGFWRAAVLSSLATLAFMAIVIPYQGHGWGYRYLHHVLGNMTLLACLAWYRLGLSEKAPARAAFVLCCAVSLALVPLRFAQAHAFVEPWAVADQEIEALGSDIVIVDAPDHLFSADLVRNIPQGREGPVRMTKELLTESQIAELCSRYSVAVFGPEEAAAAGLPTLATRDAFDPGGSGCSPAQKTRGAS